MGTVATAGLFLQLGGVSQDIHATNAARALGWRLQGGRREGGGKTVNQLYFPLKFERKIYIFKLKLVGFFVGSYFHGGLPNTEKAGEWGCRGGTVRLLWR
jgi:hypothetical protein